LIFFRNNLPSFLALCSYPFFFPFSVIHRQRKKEEEEKAAKEEKTTTKIFFF